MALLDRPARKQVTRIESQVKDKPSGNENEENYNIWYHSYSGVKRKDTWHSTPSNTKCDVEKDSGKTRARKGDYFCLHFSRGKCIQGSSCSFKHQIPTIEDEEGMQRDLARDCFGRDRHETYRDDMKGSGSFSRENKSLMITGLRMDKPLEEDLRTAFSEFGPVDRVYIVSEKAIAFVRYKWRASAEFGKEAMDGQSVDGNTIGIKWANEDPNPGQKQKEQVSIHKKTEQAVSKRLRTMSSQDHAAIAFELTGEYPNTDNQYANNSSYHSTSYPNTDSQYPSTDSQYPSTDYPYSNTDYQYSNPNTQFSTPDADAQHTNSQYSTYTPYQQLIMQAKVQKTQTKEVPKAPAVSEGLLALGDYGDDD